LLRHIFSNLLSNAIKYSPSGSAVYFKLAIEDNIATFEVQDSGIGIPPKDLPRLFESFHRASNVRDISGTGLGLAIVKNSVDLHGGKITVQSEEGLGTTFTVLLPLNSLSFSHEQNFSD
jgi:signal transduction histidine kinase